MLRSAAAVAATALVLAGSASGETVARGVPDGLLALNAKGVPTVAYVQHSTLWLATRGPQGQWTKIAAATTPPASSAVAFEIGRSGLVVLVQSGDDRVIQLVRRRSVGWQTITLAKVRGTYRLGWPGLVLDGRGQPVISYSRWEGGSLKSRLMLARVNAKGKISARRITEEGFPKSLVPPPSVPVLFGGVAHVIESYGYRGVVGTFEWFPRPKTWLGLGLDAGVGDYPVGPVLAGLSPSGVLHAAWTESMLSFDAEAAPVTLVSRRHIADSRFVLDRALTSALALPSTGPELAANQWVGSFDFGSQGDANLWAGTIVRSGSRVELDGWISGLAVAPRGARDLLLGGPDGLRWFRVPQRISTRVSLSTEADDGATVTLSGRVSGVAKGSVAIYRERPGAARTLAGRPTISGGAFTFTDRAPARPLVYRAVYVDPATRVPYAALLTRPIF